MNAGGGPPSNRLLLSSLLATPRTCAWIFGAGALHVALATTPLGGWKCPFLAATGWPCPGCGLGRAAAYLLKGDFRDSWHMHAFAGPLLLFLVTLGVGCLPGTVGDRIRRQIRRLEERTWLVPAILTGLIIYWVARLGLDGVGFRMLVV